MKELLQSALNKLKQIIAYLLLLFLPTQFGKHFWPQYSFVLGSRIDYLSPTIYFTDVLIVLLFVVWILSINRCKMYDLRLKSLTSYVLNLKSILWSLFLFFLLLNLLFSKQPTLGWYELVKFLEFIFFGWHMANFILKHRSWSLNLLSIGITFESLLAIAQFVQQKSINGILYFFGERMFSASTPGIANASIAGHLILRPYGTFSHPNVLAGYLVVVMTLIIALSVKYKVFSIKYLVFWVSIFAGTIALLLSLGRVAILVWFVILIFLLIKHFAKSIIKKRLFLLSVVASGFVILAASFLLPFVFNRFSGTSLSDESVVLREELAKDALAMIVSHPIFGAGLHNFLVALQNFDKHPSTVFTIQPVHNIFLLIAAELGIPGLLFILWFVFLLYRKLFMEYKNTTEDKRRLILFLIIALTEILILGQFDHYWLTIQQGQVIFSLVIGLIVTNKNS